MNLVCLWCLQELDRLNINHRIMSNSMKLPKVMLVLTVLLQLIPFWWKYLLGLFLFNLKGFGLDYSAAESFSIVLLALSFIVITGVSVGNYSYAKKHKDYNY